MLVPDKILGFDYNFYSAVCLSKIESEKNDDVRSSCGVTFVAFQAGIYCSFSS